MKNFKAIIFAIAITGVVAATMFFIGTNALANKNSVPMADSPQAAQTSVLANSNSSTVDQSQVAQLEALVKQYQDREQQYQSQLNAAAQRINSANSQLSQATQELQQYQALLVALQRRGVIRITNSGQIMIPSAGNFGGDDSNQSSFQ
jgi:septal ring factor EnvC (AmiA/AmiB activator)